MNGTDSTLLLADVVLMTHVVFVLFVVVGFSAVVFGRFIGWMWIQNRLFRLAHLAAIVFVVIQAYAGRVCPLTTWENALRVGAGQGRYDETFIAHWLQRLLFYEAEPWKFGIVYTIFGVLVVAATVHDWKKMH